jgi:hypothetical protein
MLRSPRYRRSFEYWQTQPTQRIVASLAPGSREPLTVKSDGRVLPGNARITILIERGYDVNELPRETIQ